MSLLDWLARRLREAEAAFFSPPAHEDSPMPLRDRIVAHALASVGLGADPAHVDAFAAFLGGEGERPEVSRAMATAPQSSTCGLVCRALLRDAGVDDRRLRAPYRIGLAISDLLAIAREHGAWVDARPGMRPQPGDIVGLALFGPDAGTHGHVFTVISVDGDNLVSVDGGQVDDRGRQCIRRKERLWSDGAGVISDGDAGSRVRVVSGWIDVGRLEAVSPAAGSVSPVATAAGTLHYMAPEQAGEVHGIDVSQFNGSIDWQRVAAAGVRFVYVRALIGKDDRDSRLMENANGARSVGLSFGVYGDDFPRHGRPQDADVQGRQLAAIHREVGATLRPMVDVEPEGVNGVSGAEWAASVTAYVEAVEHELGVSPVLYTGPGFWSLWAELQRCEVAGRCPLWLAAYLPTMPAPPAPWSSVALWQYAGNAPGFTGHVDGVSGAVDRSRLLVPIEALRV